MVSGHESTEGEGPQPGTPAKHVALRRTKGDQKVIGGVAGGLARYLGVEAVWVRIGFVALALGWGSGVLLYFILWIAIPQEKDSDPVGVREGGGKGGLILGMALIAIGLLTLLNRLVPWLDDAFWPLVLILAGVFIVAAGSRRR